VDLPAILFEDNMSAIYISKNKQVSKRTKHIDVKYHYTREFIEKDEELGCARRSDDNPAGMTIKKLVRARLMSLARPPVPGSCL